jgi:hypothetical protein
MQNVVIALILMVGCLFGSATVYDVELSYNDNDSSSAPQRQTFIATVDSISEVAFFCGKKILPGNYVFRIMDSLGGVLPGDPTAYSDSAGLFDYEFVYATFDSKVYVKKGVKYRLLVTHSEPQCTTNFYYNSSNPYEDGELIGYSGCDLAARVLGVNEDSKVPICQNV